LDTTVVSSLRGPRPGTSETASPLIAALPHLVEKLRDIADRLNTLLWDGK